MHTYACVCLTVCKCVCAQVCVFFFFYISFSLLFFFRSICSAVVARWQTSLPTLASAVRDLAVPFNFQSSRSRGSDCGIGIGAAFKGYGRLSK